MIGTQEEAETAWLIHDEYQKNWRNHEMPEGWRTLGSGMFRTAYLSPSGVVYKVENVCHDSNRDEAYRYEQVKHLNGTLPFRFAECEFMLSEGRYTVLAMEYVQTDDSDVEDSFWEMEDWLRRHFDYMDCSDWKRGQNWHALAGMAVITDYAYGNGERNAPFRL